jgi:GDPmannose 4,6-dehydratase
MRKLALISGIAGKDVSILAESSLDKSYELHGIIRISSLITFTWNLHLSLEEWIKDMQQGRKLGSYYRDMIQSSFIVRIIEHAKSCNICNLASQNYINVSYDMPRNKVGSEAFKTLRISEAEWLLSWKPFKTCFSQLSQSMMTHDLNMS